MISEEEMDEEQITSETLTPEIVPPGQLVTLVQQSGLPQPKAAILVERFSDLFRLASEWAKKAKDIIVTNGDQVVTIKHARAGRLLLREKRLEIENIRKILKADALKEGQAIDRIANFLKDLIIPTEEHLDRQEHFVENQKKAEDEAKRIEIEKRMEEERINKEKTDAIERARLQEENEKLRQAAKVKEDIDRVFREEKEKELQEERNKALRIERELQLRKQNEMKAEADRIRAEERMAMAGDSEKMLDFRAQVQAIKIPEVNFQENKRILDDAKSHLWLAVSKIKLQEED